MRTWGWFAAGFASFGIAVAGAADGFDMPAAHAPFAVQRAAPVEPASAPRPNLPSLERDLIAGSALNAGRGDAFARPGCRLLDLCYERAEGRLLYRGARRYMPSLEGMEAEGISLKRDRLILRYSFR